METFRICQITHLNFTIFTPMHEMQTWFSDENSVCLSVRLSVYLSNAWIVTK